MTFGYLDGSNEVVEIIARSPKEALHGADNKRKRKDQRAVSVVVTNSIGEIVGKLARGIGSGVKKVAKGAMILGKQAYWKGKEFAYEHELGEKLKNVGRSAAVALAKHQKNVKAEQLIRKAFSSDRVESVKARVELKQKYPEIYLAARFR